MLNNCECVVFRSQERNQKLNSRTEQLNKQINLLIEDSVGLLKTRMTELGINSGFYTKDLLAKAKEIIFRHRELQAKALKLQSKVSVEFGYRPGNLETVTSF